MKLLRILAVDDEVLAIDRLKMWLDDIPDVALVGVAHGGQEGLRLTGALRPDLLLLDINMPGVSGFEMLDALEPAELPLVIFTTAYDEHAVRAFRANAVDYLLKPVEPERLVEALDKARTTLRLMDADQRASRLRMLLKDLQGNAGDCDEPEYEVELWVPKANKFERVQIADIDWIEAERDYVNLHSRSRSWLLRETLAKIQIRLNPNLFMRVHRSALVRRDRIISIRRTGSGRLFLILRGGAEVPVGAKYAKQVRDLLRRRP